MSAFLGIALFVIGVLLAVWATERLLEGQEPRPNNAAGNVSLPYRTVLTRSRE